MRVGLKRPSALRVPASPFTFFLLQINIQRGAEQRELPEKKNKESSTPPLAPPIKSNPGIFRSVVLERKYRTLFLNINRTPSVLAAALTKKDK